MRFLFDQKEIAKLLGISESQIRYWEKKGLIPYIKKEKGKVYFDFKALVAFKTIKELQEKGISLRKIRNSLERFKKLMPEIKYPLAEMKVSIVGKKIVFDRKGLKIDPNGQLLLDFFHSKSEIIHFPVNLIEEWFFQALQYEEEGQLEKAKEYYLKILSSDPNHINALVNLGNIQYQFGILDEAENYYRKALSLNPNHPEANYNLANLLEEKGDIKNAILFYQKAIYEDPEFADAYFNLARLLEKKGELKEAKKCWRIYLELDPDSEWAEYARQRLEDN